MGKERFLRIVVGVLAVVAMAAAQDNENTPSAAPTLHTVVPTVSHAPTTTPNNSTTSPAPSPAPSKADVTPTVSPAPTVSAAPTIHNATVSPAPTPAGNNTQSPVPSFSPTAVHLPTVSPAPTHTVQPKTPAPTKVPTEAPTTKHPTESPTKSPTKSPTQSPTVPSHHHHHHHHHKRPSVWKIIGKTIGWLILCALALLGFGFVMNNRYRIYYYIRSAWYRFWRWEGTRWFFQKTRLDRLFPNATSGGMGGGSGDLNEIIFDNDMNTGLLMQEN